MADPAICNDEPAPPSAAKPGRNWWVGPVTLARRRRGAATTSGQQNMTINQRARWRVVAAIEVVEGYERAKSRRRSDAASTRDSTNAPAVVSLASAADCPA